MPSRKNKSMTKEEIRDVLEKHYNKTYGGAIIKRELLVCKSKECFFFALDGTPPKGFGIYIPERKILRLYEAEGKKIKEYCLQLGIIDIDNK